MAGLRERKKQRVRAAILDSAEAMLRERGFEATRIRDVIEPVEISEPTFFKYFASKQQLVDELALQWLRDSTAAWPRPAVDGSARREILEPLGVALGPFVDALQRDRSYVRLLLNHSSLWNPQGTARGKHAESGHPLHETTMAGFRAMADFFGQLQKEGHIRHDIDPLQVSEIAFGIFRTTLQLWATGYWAVEYELSDRLSSAFDILLKGLAIRE